MADCLTQCIDESGAWIKASFMRLNPDKTEVILVGWGKQPDDTEWTISVPLVEGVCPRKKENYDANSVNSLQYSLTCMPSATSSVYVFRLSALRGRDGLSLSFGQYLTP